MKNKFYNNDSSVRNIPSVLSVEGTSAISDKFMTGMNLEAKV